MAQRVAEAVPLDVLVWRILTEQGGASSQSGCAPAPCWSAAGAVRAPLVAEGAEFETPFGTAAASGPDVAVAAVPHADLAAPLDAEVALARAESVLADSDCKFVMNSVTGVALRVGLRFDVVAGHLRL